eukprot:278440_1
MTTTFGSVILACPLWFGIRNTDDALWAGFVGWACFYAIGMATVTFLMMKKKQADPSLTWKSMYYDLLMRNVMELRSDLVEVVGFMPIVWALLVKHFIPLVIIILFSLDADSGKFAFYSGYPTKPYQVLGVLIVVFAALLFVSSLVLPKMYNALQKPDEPVQTIKKPGSSIHVEPENAPEDTVAKGDIEAQPEGVKQTMPEETVEPEEIAD